MAGDKLCHWEKASINMTKYALALNSLAVTVLVAKVTKYIFALCKEEEFVLIRRSGVQRLCDLTGNGNLLARGCEQCWLFVNSICFG